MQHIENVSESLRRTKEKRVKQIPNGSSLGSRVRRPDEPEL